MRVSVALCTHEGARYVEEQLRSILDQTHPVDEIVVGDDASTDETLAIFERIAATTDVPFLIARHDPALGLVANFSDAIQRTSGDVVALCDQDDVWHPNRIATMLAALEGVDLAHSDARLVDADGVELGETLLQRLGATPWERERMRDGRAIEALLRRNLVTGATTLVRREAALAALPVPEGWIHDEWIAMACALGGGVRLVDTPTIDYRQHDRNQIGVQRLSLATKLRRLVEDDGGRQARKSVRAESLVAASTRLQVDAAARAALAAKAKFERARAQLPRSRVARAPFVTHSALLGGYRRFARGFPDAVRDLLQSR